MKRILYIPLILMTSGAFCQVETIEPEETHSIRNHFDDMLKNSNRYQEFKVVKITKLNQFINEVQDSLDVNQKKYNNEVGTTDKLRAEVKMLNDTIAAKDARVNTLISQRDNIDTVGMSMDKKAFSAAMWFALLCLVGLLVVLFLRNKAIAMSQKQLKNNLIDLEGELVTVKKKALEREQELKREVQDYINKIEAMGPPR